MIAHHMFFTKKYLLFFKGLQGGFLGKIISYNGIFFIQKVDSCSSTVFIFGQDSRKTVHDGREVFFILLLSSLSLYQKNMSAVSGEQRDSTSYKPKKGQYHLKSHLPRFFILIEMISLHFENIVKSRPHFPKILCVKDCHSLAGCTS